MIKITQHPDAVFFQVRLTPRSSRNSIDGEHDGALKIRLTAPPIDSRANEALRKFLAAALHVSASSVTILSGEKSRTKRIQIKGVTRNQILCLLPTENT
jgi:uncharacterized protein (TIGR00251 family)